MVIHIFVFLLSAILGAASESPFSFKLELSQRSVFQGEQVTANFILESPMEQAVEIEVMKFPEFRGFWSENLVLRQGPIHLMAVAGPKKKAIGLVGSYVLSSILGLHSPTVEPMRILVKSFGGPSVILSSEGTFPPVTSLPSVPPPLGQFPFSGAVGTFRLSVAQPQIPYRANQPFVIRAQLQGEGNFAEINSLPISSTSDLNLISHTSFLEPSSGGFRKSFEWVFNTEKGSLNEWDPGSFLTFNPKTKGYELLKFPSIRFINLPETSLPGNILKMGAVPFVPETSWGPRTNLKKSVGFWLVQVLLGMSLLGRTLWVQIRARNERRRADPVLRKKLMIQEASAALKNQNWEEFLALASRLARQFMSEQNSPIPTESLQTFVEADNQLRFSPLKTLTIPKETLKKHWKKIQESK